MRKKYLYHGSIIAGIEEIEPRKRFIPAELVNEAKPAVYAADNPGYAAGHGFPWKSSEGFDIYEYEGKIVLKAPRKFKDRLKQKLFVYKLPAKDFKLLKKDSLKTSIYFSYEKVRPISVKFFSSVKNALDFYNVKVVYV